LRTWDFTPKNGSKFDELSFGLRLCRVALQVLTALLPITIGLRECSNAYRLGGVANGLAETRCGTHHN
jgi:hypothetical protein